MSDVSKLMLDMEKGKAKVSFFGKNKKAVKVAMRCADGSDKTLSNLQLVAGDKATDKITLSDLGDAVKYLRIENTTASVNYKLAKLA